MNSTTVTILIAAFFYLISKNNTTALTTTNASSTAAGLQTQSSLTSLLQQALGQSASKGSSGGGGLGSGGGGGLSSGPSLAQTQSQPTNLAALLQGVSQTTISSPTSLDTSTGLLATVAAPTQLPASDFAGGGYVPPTVDATLQPTSIPNDGYVPSNGADDFGGGDDGFVEDDSDDGFD